MSGLLMLALQWLLACAGSALAGLLAWALLNGAARRWPALRTRSDVWLAAQIVIAAAALPPFLPRAEQISVTPRITLAPADIAPAPMPGAPGAAAPRPHAATGIHPGAAPQPDPAISADIPQVRAAAGAETDIIARPGIAPSTSNITLWLAAIWLSIYAAGLAWSGARLLHAHRLWRALLAGAQRLSPQALRDHGAFSDAQLREIAQRNLTVLRTEAAVSPMLIGVYRPRLLLPARLDALTREQQHMIVAHELHHLRNRDPLRLATASFLRTIFWFNPALRWMARQMAWALELHCDQHVLAGRPQQQRKQYAAALLQQWTAFAPAGAAAFGGATITARLRGMQQNSLPTLSGAVTWMIAAALSFIVALTAMLQPALAYAPHVLPVATVAAPEQAWRAPLDEVRVTSFFGVRRSVLPTPHKGIDFGAAKGTPVHATAGGTVIAAGPIAENDGRYGNTVIIDHGAQRSLYAHLDSVNVTPGQHVQAGQLIGAVGQSGFATGPHLHLEVRENGRIIDPATKLANLDAYATPRALKVRRQQKG